MHSISKMRSFFLSHLHPPLLQPSHFHHGIQLLPLQYNQSSQLSLRRSPLFLRRRQPGTSITIRSHASESCCGDAHFSATDGGKAANCGEIHVIVGPMFAGKTTALLHRVQVARSNGRNVAMIKSNKDNRYGLDSVVTHDGMKMPCWAVSELFSIQAKMGAEAYSKLDVIGIDEAQFFEDLYDFCCHAADHDGKAVIVAGLDGDYLRRSFGSVIDIIPLADSVTKLTARCGVCGERASFTLRKTAQTKTEVIGGADVYMPVCRHHYMSGQVVIKAAKEVLGTRMGQSELYLEAGSLPS